MPEYGNTIMRKSKLIIYILVAMLTTGIVSNNADAQWWKKRKERRSARKHKHDQEVAVTDDSSPAPEPVSKKERKKDKRERKRLKRAARKQHHKTPANDDDLQYAQTVAKPKVKKKGEVIYPPTRMKDSYRIDFLAALYLDELEKEGKLGANQKVPEKAFPGISFYEGLTLAADSLKKAGYNVELFVHDITAETETPQALIANGRLDSADLIIGAFHSQDMPLIAEYARRKQVNFISALSPADIGIKDNPYFTMTQPSLKTHCEWIIDDVAKKYPAKNVILLHRDATQVDENAFNYINNYNDGYVHFKDISLRGMPEKATLQPLLDSGEINVLVVSIIDPGYSDSLLQVVSKEFPHTRFEVYGMPSWFVIDDIHEEGVLPNLTVNVTMPFNIDHTDAVTKYVSRKFKCEYGGKASELVYRGYETMYWYTSLLKSYGTIFNLNYADIAGAPFTRYDIKLKKDKEGNVLYNENNHIYLYKTSNEATTNKAD